MDLTFSTDSGRFNLRVAVLLIENDCLLLQGAPGVDYWVPPGGRCTLHEDTEAAARREIAEELGCQVTLLRPLWCVENFFGLDGVRYHELTFVYLGQLPSEHRLPTHRERFVAVEGDQFFQWIPLDAIAQTAVFPEVLRERVRALPTSLERLVVRS